MFVLTLAWFLRCSCCHLHLRQVEGEHHCCGAAAFCILSEDAQSVLQFHPPKPKAGLKIREKQGSYYLHQHVKLSVTASEDKILVLTENCDIKFT